MRPLPRPPTPAPLLLPANHGCTTRPISLLRDINVAESMFWMNEWMNEWKALSKFQLQRKHIIIFSRRACLSAGDRNISQQYHLERLLRLTGGHLGFILFCCLIIRKSIVLFFFVECSSLCLCHWVMSNLHLCVLLCLLQQPTPSNVQKARRA